MTPAHDRLADKLALPFWGQQGQLQMLFYRGFHSKTRNPMPICVASIEEHMLIAHGARKGQMLYKLSLYHELIPGTARFTRMVTNGKVTASIDGRYYDLVSRQGMSLSAAQVMAVAHAPVTEEALDTEAGAMDWGRTVIKLPDGSRAFTDSMIAEMVDADQERVRDVGRKRDYTYVQWMSDLLK